MIAAPEKPKLDHRGLPPPGLNYDDPGPIPFWVFLLVSLGVFTLGTVLGICARWGETPAFVLVDLIPEIDGTPGEPPPLGDPEAGKREEPISPQPEQPPVVEKTEQPLPDPVPVQSDFPEPEPIPTPIPVTPPPKPNTPKPRIKDSTPPHPNGTRTSGDNPDPNAKPGIRGVPGGTPGSKGGQKGNFISRPNPLYDNLMYTRKYQGKGYARIQVSAGRITNVELVRKTGIPYLDSKAIAWIRSNWKPAPSTEGTFQFEVVFQLQRLPPTP